MNEEFEKLLKLFTYVKENIPYYKNLNVQQMTLSNYKEFISKIPIVSKSDIRNNYVDFVSKELGNVSYIFDKKYMEDEHVYVNNKDIFVETTTGTSGIPLVLIKSFNERIKLGRILHTIRADIDAKAAKKMCYFLNHNNSLDNIPIVSNRNQIINVKKEIEYLNNNPSFAWWHISLSRLEMYMKYLLENNIEFNNHKYLKIIENNGFYLSKTIKEQIEQVFNCKVYDHFGCKEAWTISFTCPYGYHHINQKNIFFELVDDEGNIITENNIKGNILITSLNQFYMPFIRYKLDDEAYYMEEKCPCGSKSKRICLVPKRNIIKGTNLCGDEEFRVIIRELTVSKKFTSFESISVVQNSLNSFVFYIINNKENKKNLEKCIYDIVRNRLSNKYTISFIYSSVTNYKGIFTCIC